MQTTHSNSDYHLMAMWADGFSSRASTIALRASYRAWSAASYARYDPRTRPDAELAVEYATKLAASCTKLARS